MGLFDNIPDWNRNGKHDAGDAFMDYMIAQDCLGISSSDSRDDDDGDDDDD